jgi:hypothetical protein
VANLDQSWIVIVCCRDMDQARIFVAGQEGAVGSLKKELAFRHRQSG